MSSFQGENRCFQGKKICFHSKIQRNDTRDSPNIASIQDLENMTRKLTSMRDKMLGFLQIFPFKMARTSLRALPGASKFTKNANAENTQPELRISSKGNNTWLIVLGRLLPG